MKWLCQHRGLNFEISQRFLHKFGPNYGGFYENGRQLNSFLNGRHPHFFKNGRWLGHNSKLS